MRDESETAPLPRRRASVALLLALGVTLLFAAPALADGVPDITMQKSTSGTVLYGDDSEVTITIANPTGQPVGYNASVRDVLPPGISYVPGSSPAAVGEPQVIDDAPDPGETTLIWANLADLTPNSSYSFSYRVSHDISDWEVGDSYTNNASAYVNCDPAYEPDFDANGEATQSGGSPDCSGPPPEESYTGSATASASTRITALEIAKSEPSPEGKLLRGLHDHQTVYTLTVTNNAVANTDDLAIEDFIPAGLEFLGCGEDDNTTDAPTNPGSAQEYPGSGPINPGNAPAAPGCVEPDEVQTVLNPPGHPAGVYTRVRWTNLADLTTSGGGRTFTLRYVAAIPIRANTMDWNGAGPGVGIPPLPGSGNQASNLDNNSGSETDQEGADAPGFTNVAEASGTYTGGETPVTASDSDSETVTAHDLRVLKSVDSDALQTGAVSEWTLNVATGEYRFADDVTVSDTLGDGYCPLGSANFEVTPPPAKAECDPTGDQPTAPYTTVDEQADGTWDITWDSSTDPALARLEPSSVHQITFPTRTRSHYQEDFDDDEPVLAFDTTRNDVDVDGTDWVRCAPGDPSPTIPATCGGGSAKIDHDEPDGTVDSDDSGAAQSGGGPTIDKSVDAVANTGNCATSTYSESRPDVRPGDTLCFRLRMTFPASLSSENAAVSDFIPKGSTYVAGSTQVMPANTVALTTASPPEPDVSGRRLRWPIDDGGGFVGPDQVFDVVFKIRVLRQSATADGDVVDNLMKAVLSNSAGETFPLRDSAGYELAQPEITLLKGVRQVNGGTVNGPNVDNVTVPAGSTVTFRIDIANDGQVDADDAQVWDLLPDGISCADVPAGQISNGGACNSSENRIEWNGIGVDADDSTTLTYDVILPDSIAPSQNLVNQAGVRRYTSPSGTGPYTTIPSDNIDPTQNANANAGPADDPSNIRTTAIAMSKTRTTAIDEAGNAAANQATIGERVDYTVTAQVPAGTTLYGADTALIDNLGTRQTLTGTPTATLDSDGPGGAAPVPLPTNGLTLSTSGNTVRIDFPDPYVNATGSGNDIIELRFSATVDDDYPANYAQGTSTQRTLPNTATLGFQDSTGGPHTSSASTSTTIVEPNVAIAKTSNAGATVSPGEVVSYTLTASNGSGARVSTAHDAVVVDELPAGLQPVNAGVPVADGGTVNPDGGIWDATARTITWDIAALGPGASTALHYDVQVLEGVVGGSELENEATLEVASIDGTPAGSRTSGSAGNPPGYSARAEHSITVETVAITKEVTPGQGTIGDPFTYTLTFRIPANITEHDVVVTDDLPDGLVFDEYVSAQCTAGCSPGPTNIVPATIAPTIDPDGTSRLGWWLGDLDAAPGTRTVELVYHAHIGDTYSDSSDVADGDVLTNTATEMFNLTDELTDPPTSPPDPDGFDQSDTATAEIDVVEPELAIDKDVSGDPDDDDARDADPGDDFTYTLRVTNNGTSPAYDVSVTDRPDVELTNVAATDGASFLTDGWTAGDPDMSWLIPGPIAPGDSVVLRYTADLVPSAQLSQGQQVTNTADIPNYFGVSGSDRAANPGFDFREYDDVDPDTVTVTVRVPDLTLDKTTGQAGNPNSGDATIENAFPWRIVLTNPNAGSSLLGVDLTDALPPNWSYVPGSAEVSGTGSLTPGGQVEPMITGGGSTLTWTNLGGVRGAETIVVEFEAKPAAAAVLNPGVGDDANVNDAEAGGEDTSGATASADGPYSDDDDAFATLAVPEADLAITKTADDPTPTAGGNTSWTLVATNNGPQTAPAVVVTDQLPSGLTYVSATPEQGTCDFDGRTSIVTCELGEMASGDSVEIDLVTGVGADQAGNVLVNPADVVDPNIDESDTDNNHDEDQVVPEAQSDLVVDKELLDDQLVLGSLARYRITVTNPGPSVARDVVITDPLPDELEYVAADDPGCSATGQLVTCPIGNIQPGGSRSVILTVRVVDFSPTVTNTAHGESDGGADDDDTTDPMTNTDLALTKVGPRKIKPGKRATYKLRVKNVGEVPSGGTATVTDRLPRGMVPFAAAGSGWDCTIAGQRVACTRSDSLAPGRTWPLIRIRVDVADDVGRKVVNSANVSIPGDPVIDNNDDAAKAKRKEPAPSCAGGEIVANPPRIISGGPTSLSVRVLGSDGRPVAGVEVEVKHKPGGDRTSERTNGHGQARFRVEAASSGERWIIRVAECHLKEVVESKAPQSCRAGDPDVTPAEAADQPVAGTPRRRC